MSGCSPPKTRDGWKTRYSRGSAGSGVLLLLSFTLSQMYEVFATRWRIDHFTDRILTSDDYEKVGGATGPLGKRADDVYSQLTKKDLAFDHTIPNVMLRMVRLTGEGGAPIGVRGSS